MFIIMFFYKHYVPISFCVRFCEDSQANQNVTSDISTLFFEKFRCTARCLVVTDGDILYLHTGRLTVALIKQIMVGGGNLPG